MRTGPERYINASVEQFAKCLTERHRLAEKRIAFESAEAELAASAFEKCLRGIDATAFDDPESMWSVIVEEFHYGT